jgi:dienelactone hydrolase
MRRSRWSWSRSPARSRSNRTPGCSWIIPVTANAKASPAGIRDNLKASILAAVEKLKLGTNDLPEKVCVFGHSLGCAAALLAVREFHLRSAVLCAPFTSTHEMARLRFEIPPNFPLKHPFDNRLGLAELRANHGHAWIFHGDADDVIPVEMSKTLAGEFKDVVTLEILAGTRHGNVMKSAGGKLVEAMREAEK